MTDPVPKPNALKLLCFAFLLWSVLSGVVDIPRWKAVAASSAAIYVFPMDIGVFGFIAAIGLWRLSSWGRTFALMFTWYWLIGSVLLFFRVFPTRYLYVTSNTDFLANVPQGILRVFVVPFFLVQLWQLHTLKKPRFKSLFERPTKPSIA